MQEEQEDTYVRIDVVFLIFAGWNLGCHGKEWFRV